MKNLILPILLTLLFGAGTLTLHSQVTTATLVGSVRSADGEGLTGASVVAVHTPTGTRYGVTSQDNGRFTLANLRVGGPYIVEATYIGYRKQTYEGVFLNLAQKLELSFELAAEAVSTDEVVITADPNGIIDDKRTGASTNISNNQLRVLPTISRSAADYTRLNPASDGNSFAGRNDQFNNFSLDGSIFNNPFGLDAATPGGQTDAQPVSLDAIEQIQVSIAPYDVTQSGFTGAAVNAVTKSGTNEFSGTVFGFFRNQSMTGAKVGGDEINVADLNQFQTGFSLGGPIIKNKLFFFANLEIERRADQGSNFIAAGAGRQGENVSRVEAADLEAVSAALASLGYETGPYEDYTHQTNNEKGILKLDWNLSENHTLSATYNFLNAFKEKPAHPSALGRRGPDATTLQFFNSGYRINNIIHSGLVEVKSIFGNRSSNKFRVGYTAFRDSRDPMSAPFPVLNINRDGIRYIVAGHEPFSVHNRLDQDVFQLTNNFNIYAGAHTLTIGTSFERFDFNNSFNLGVYEPFGVNYPGGTFGPGFESVEAFLAYAQTADMQTVIDHAENLFAANGGDEGVEGEGWALAETNVGQWAFYVQDEWDINDNFKLTLGIRSDLPLYFNTPEKAQENIDRNCCYDPSITYYDEEGAAVTFDHTVLPEQRPLISPRLGFNYDLTGNGSSQLRGGTGLFTGRFPFVWVGNQVANPNSYFYTVTRPDFRFPQVWRTNLGLDQQFAGGWLATFDLIYTRDINGMMVRNYGLKPPTATLQTSFDDRPIYGANDRAANNAYVFTNTDIGYTFNASVQIQRTWENGFFTSLGYNFLDAKDASSIEAEISSDAYDRNPAFGNVNEAILGPSLYGNRHRIVGAAYKKFEYGNNLATTVSLFFQYAQGGRFSYTYSGDINADASGLNDLIYIPTQAEIGQMNFAGSSAEQQRAALEAFISQDEYLSANRGEYAEKYAILSPWYNNWDLRVLQDIGFNAGKKVHKIQISLDVLNIGNLVNSNWGVRQIPVNTQPIGVSVAGGVPTYSFDTALDQSFTNDFSLLSRWQAQLGLRYIF
ncbi:MAG: TonB-dependent receptor [Bacteroidia bacterium]|nr:TonB-dependent receptor [Bacteroidia bacterium]